MSEYRDDRGQLRARLEEVEAELAKRDAELAAERERVVELGARLAESGKQVERLREENVATAGESRAVVGKRRRDIGITLFASAGVAAVLAMAGNQATAGQAVLLGFAVVAAVIGLVFVSFAL